MQALAHPKTSGYTGQHNTQKCQQPYCKWALFEYLSGLRPRLPETAQPLGLAVYIHIKYVFQAHCQNQN
jgi:hypothetical protein